MASSLGSISARSAHVRQLFRNAIAQLGPKGGPSFSHRHDPGPSQNILARDVTDALDRFSLWAGNLGALLPSTSRLSLDQRLSDAPETSERISPEGSSGVDNDDDLGLEEAEPASDSLGQGFEPGAPAETLEDSSGDFDEARSLLNCISEYLRSLFRIAVIVRSAGPHDRFKHALQASNTTFTDIIDINHLREKHPKLPENLRTLLGRANAKRRQFLKYSRDHSLRLAVERDESEKVETTESRPAQTEFLSSKATIFAQPNPDLVEEDVFSLISASTVSGENQVLSLPRLATLSPDGAPFECPLCRTFQTFQQGAVWQKHAYRDLKAYTCTAGCDSMFGDRKAWFEHELRTHRIRYTCRLCSSPDSLSEDQLTRHVSSTHGHFPEGHMQKLLDSGREPITRFTAEDCPFCDDWALKLQASRDPKGKRAENRASGILVSASRFRRHVAAHHEQLAIFVVPREIDDSNSGTPNSGSIGAASTARSDVLSNLGFQHNKQTTSLPIDNPAENGSDTRAPTAAFSRPDTSIPSNAPSTFEKDSNESEWSFGSSRAVWYPAVREGPPDSTIRAKELKELPQAVEEQGLEGPTSALWLGSIPTSTTTSTLTEMFKSYGPILSARVLTHKNCGFVNFERIDSAISAKASMNDKEIFPGAGPIRINFAKSSLASNAPSYDSVFPSPSPDPSSKGQDSAQYPPCDTLNVQNLPLDTSEEELKATFSKQDGYKRLCFRTPGPRCLIQFEDVPRAVKALNNLFGHRLHNSVDGPIQLSFARLPLAPLLNQDLNVAFQIMDETGSAMLNYVSLQWDLCRTPGVFHNTLIDASTTIPAKITTKIRDGHFQVVDVSNRIVFPAAEWKTHVMPGKRFQIQLLAGQWPNTPDVTLDKPKEEGELLEAREELNALKDARERERKERRRKEETEEEFELRRVKKAAEGMVDTRDDTHIAFDTRSQQSDTHDALEARDEFSRFDQGPLDHPAFIPDSDDEDNDATPPPIAREPSRVAEDPAHGVANAPASPMFAVPPALDRWAQIRKNAADRASQRQSEQHGQGGFSKTTDSDGDTDEEFTIETRVARIKARIAELTRNL
ncbi:hypothetical protein RB599_009001 [Gaeumannomyces hyphopodioides]